MVAGEVFLIEPFVATLTHVIIPDAFIATWPIFVPMINIIIGTVIPQSLVCVLIVTRRVIVKVVLIVLIVILGVSQVEGRAAQQQQ